MDFRHTFGQSKVVGGGPSHASGMKSGVFVPPEAEKLPTKVTEEEQSFTADNAAGAPSSSEVVNVAKRDQAVLVPHEEVHVVSIDLVPQNAAATVR